MKKLSCLIVEDAELDAHLLMNILKQQALFQHMDWSQTATDALCRLATTSYDLIFLDMRMPDQLGTDFLRDTPHRPPVIVMTASLEFAVPCYDLSIVDFLSKPLEQPRLQRAINRTLSKSQTEPINPYTNSIFFQANRQMKRFLFNDIHFVEAHGAYAKIHSSQGATVVSHAISWIETQLPANQFLRIQKSYIVNLHHITAIEARSVWVNTTKLSVGTQYVDQLRQFIRKDGQDPAWYAAN